MSIKIKDRKANALLMVRAIFNEYIEYIDSNINNCQKQMKEFESKALGPDTGTDEYFQDLNNAKTFLRALYTERHKVRVALETTCKALKGYDATN
jgi:hypothetical protein